MNFNLFFHQNTKIKLLIKINDNHIAVRLSAYLSGIKPIYKVTNPVTGYLFFDCLINL